MSLKALKEQTNAFLADQNDASRETLASNLAGVVQACDFHSALPEELLANLTSLLYATLQKEIPTVSQTAQLLQDAFAALPKSTDLDLDEPANPSATGERIPQSVVEVLQTAILDACWTCDATFEATGESWPPAKDTQSPARFKLRGLLAALIPQIPFNLQKLRVAVLLSTENPADRYAATMEVRTRTAMFYKQQKFNLLREESEGFSKLATELLANMGPEHDQNGLPTESEEARDKRAKFVMKNIFSLIGFFNLDPTRTLDIILDVFSDNVTHHHHFFRSLLRNSPWGKESFAPLQKKQTKSQDVEMDDATSTGASNEPDGGLGEEKGNNTMAQILGFKFAFYQTPEIKVETPPKLYLLAAVLIWDGFVRLSDLYPHLSPDDQTVEGLRSKHNSAILAKAKAGSSNALLMAGTLDGIDRSSSSSRSRDDAPEKKVHEPPNQKVGILKALLGIGDLKSSLFILSKFNWLVGPHPEIADLMLRILNVVLEPAYAHLSRASSGVSRGFSQRQSFYSTTEKKIVPAATLPTYLTAWACHGAVPGCNFNYFWAEWKERLPISENVEEVMSTVVHLLRFVGPQAHRNMAFLTKLIRLGASDLSTRKITDAESAAPWIDICRLHIIPTLTLSEANPGLSVSLWNLFSHIPMDVRYGIYGEWKERIPKLYPEVRAKRAEADKETKGLMKRLGNDPQSHKRFGRQFAKVAHTDPCTIFSIVLHQVENYDNIISPTIEAMRYLAMFEYDVMSYSILEALSDPSRDRTKSDGTHTSLWLQGLSTFVAVLHRRWPVEVKMMVLYVIKQLAAGNASDLIILRDLVSKLGGLDVVSPADISESGIYALSGGKTLRTEFASQTTIASLRNSRRPGPTKHLNRLRAALDGTGYGRPLLLRIAQIRQTSIFTANEGDAVQLKYLSNLHNTIHATLYQYIDFLATVLTPAEYSNMVPSLADLWSVYGIEPSIAFQMIRSKVLPAMRENDIKAKATNQDIITSEKPTAAITVNEALADVKSTAASLLPTQVTTFISPELFASFWCLELRDIHLPSNTYKSLKARVDDLPSSEGFYEMKDVSEREVVKLRVRERSLTLDRERESQRTTIDAVCARLQVEVAHWFPTSINRVATAAQFSQHLMLPRAKLSPMDALFSSRFVQLLHEYRTPNFNTILVLDQLFSEQLAPTIFRMTEDEVRNFSRFLADILRWVRRWFDSEETFRVEAVGMSPKGSDEPHRFRPGMVQRPPAPGASIAEANCLSYSRFKYVHQKWQAGTITALRSCIESREYMGIRNGLLVLSQVVDYVPYVVASGQNLQAFIKTLAMKEEREDIKMLANVYSALLTKRSKYWEPALMLPSGGRGAPPTAPSSKAQTNGTTAQSPAPSPAQPNGVSTARSSTPTGPAEAKPPVDRSSDSKSASTRPTSSKVYYSSAQESSAGKVPEASPHRDTGSSALPSRPGPPSRQSSAADVPRVQNAATSKARSDVPARLKLESESTSSQKAESSVSSKADNRSTSNEKKPSEAATDAAVEESNKSVPIRASLLPDEPLSATSEGEIKTTPTDTKSTQPPSGPAGVSSDRKSAPSSDQKANGLPVGLPAKPQLPSRPSTTDVRSTRSPAPAREPARESSRRDEKMPPPRAPSPRRRSPPPSRPGSSLSSRIPDSPRRDAREEPSRASRTDDRAPPSRSRNASPDSAHSKDRDGRDRRSDRDRKALSAEEERLARRRDSDRREADRASDRVREKDKKDRDREKGKEREAPRGSDRSDRDRRRSRSRSRERVKQDRSGSRRDDDREKRERPKQETERKVSASQREPSPKRRRVDDKEDLHKWGGESESRSRPVEPLRKEPEPSNRSKTPPRSPRKSEQPEEKKAGPPRAPSQPSGWTDDVPTGPSSKVPSIPTGPKGKSGLPTGPRGLSISGSSPASALASAPIASSAPSAPPAGPISGTADVMKAGFSIKGRAAEAPASKPQRSEAPTTVSAERLPSGPARTRNTTATESERSRPGGLFGAVTGQSSSSGTGQGSTRRGRPSSDVRRNRDSPAESPALRDEESESRKRKGDLASRIGADESSGNDKKRRREERSSRR